ncbi:MFS transporter [Hymenobacter sp. ISL-91]|uniref:MFS transporter n=1 Tax=Hymenobacter sp. ISL-91 TaxID=2819151 RepID=UPI002035C364|nr:MFS transporter [Hymenobacter sp. ISL-91]
MASPTATVSADTRDKPRMSFWQIWNMSFGFLGIQFGFELQNSNVSRIFETLGASKDDLPLLWIAAPLTGLLVQPIVGYFSDRTWHPTWGRRRPFFFLGAVLATLSLFIMPNSGSLLIAAGMLWVMDASINISMEPFRAFVGDLLPNNQRTTGFATQSFFIGIGSVIAAGLPWVFTNLFDIANIAPQGQIPPSVKYAFYAGGVAFFLAVMYTVVTTREYPPANMAEFEREKAGTRVFDGLKESFMGIFHMPKAMQQLAVVQLFTWFALFAMWIYSTNAITSNIYDMHVDNKLFAKIEQRVQAASASVKDVEAKSFFDLSAATAAEMQAKQLTALRNDLADINRFQSGNSDKVITTNLAGYALKSTDFTPAEVATLTRVQQQYNDGADWLGICSSVRNGVAALFAFLLPVLARRTSRRFTHMLCLVVGGLGLISLRFVDTPALLAVAMGLVGIAWASILSMPYAMLAGALPANKMGYYMGVFNFFIVIPQIVAATVLGFLTIHLFSGNTLSVLVLGGVTMVVGGLLTLRVDDADDIRLVSAEPVALEGGGYDAPVETDPRL